ncbi:MAG: hypothetical protein ABI220_05105 [Candidatus Saccharimonadales bacterium]
MKYIDFANNYEPSYTVGNYSVPGFSEIEAAAAEIGSATYDYLHSKTTLQTVGSLAMKHSTIVQANPQLFNELTDPEATNNQPLKSRYSAEAGHLIMPAFAQMLALDDSQYADRGVRNFVANNSTHGLSIYGILLLDARNDLMTSEYKTPGLPYRYFSKYYETFRSISTGGSTEIDVALILTEMQRKIDGFRVIGSCPQFERGAFNKANQADFIALYEPTGQATAIQVKSRVSQDDYDRYNHDTTVLISGNEDLDNVRLAQLYPGKSESIEISAPGYVALHRLANMPLDKTRLSQYSPRQRMEMARIRNLARQQNNIAPRFQTAYERIVGRILPSLGVQLDVQPKYTPALSRHHSSRRLRAS